MYRPDRTSRRISIIQVRWRGGQEVAHSGTPGSSIMMSREFPIFAVSMRRPKGHAGLGTAPDLVFDRNGVARSVAQRDRPAPAGCGAAICCSSICDMADGGLAICDAAHPYCFSG